MLWPGAVTMSVRMLVLCAHFPPLICLGLSVGWGVLGFIIAALLFVSVSPGDSKRKLGRQAGGTCL